MALIDWETGRKMNETEFNQHADELMIALEEAIDDSGADLDYENNNGVLTITMEANGSVVIVSRQSAIVQIWVAAKSGGFHFEHRGELDDFSAWVCTTTGETLPQLLNRTCSEQSGETVELDF